jgi:putative FmdB family regulatory protein
MALRFVDYKCKDCKYITEIVITGDNKAQKKCEKCGSKNMVKVFSPVGIKSSSDENDHFQSSSSCSSCTSSSCSTCSGSK